MKRYELEDLDLTESGRTDCNNCPLNDEELSMCSVCMEGCNYHLSEGSLDNVPCDKVVVKLKTK